MNNTISKYIKLYQIYLEISYLNRVLLNFDLFFGDFNLMTRKCDLNTYASGMDDSRLDWISGSCSSRRASFIAMYSMYIQLLIQFTYMYYF